MPKESPPFRVGEVSNGINEEDLELINNFFLDYQDLLFYVESKNKREEATYSSNYIFNKKSVEYLRLKTTLFFNKVKKIFKDFS